MGGSRQGGGGKTQNLRGGATNGGSRRSNKRTSDAADKSSSATISAEDHDAEGQSRAVRSRDCPIHRSRGQPPASRPGADSEREFRLTRRARGDGNSADQQIRGGLAGKALLRRMRVRGHGGAMGHRPGEAALLRG